MPERIQRKRTKGWRMPPNTVYVGRPSKWGNGFYVGPDLTAAQCVERYRDEWTRYLALAPDLACSDLEELRGKNLACWCKPGEPCHADVLLEIANS